MVNTKKIIILILGLLYLLSFFSCSTMRQVKPLKKGENSLIVSYGGPVTDAGIYMPLPFLSVSLQHGVHEKVDVGGGLYITHFLYGNWMIDGTVNYRPWFSEKARPGLMLSMQNYFLLGGFSALFEDKKNGIERDDRYLYFRWYPDLIFTLFWELGGRHYLYTGMENWFELTQNRPDGNEQPHHWLIAPFLGIHVGNERWLFQFEFKLYTPNLSNKARATKNIGLGDKGIIGFHIGSSWILGKEKNDD